MGAGSLPTSDSAYDGYTYSLKESYCYDEKGLVSAIVDHIANTKTVYSYDTEGKPTQVVRFDKNGGLTAEFYENVTYNSVGLVSTGVDGYALNGTKYTDRYTYAYDALQRLSVMYYGYSGSANRYTYAYDGLSRVTNRTLTYGGLTVSQNYTYAVETGSFGESETGRVESVTQTIGSTTTTYTYTYDDRGNITKIYINGGLQYSFEYDNLNQLTRENDGNAYVTYTYSYDDAGNLLTKTTYPFTHGTLGEPKQTKTYTYGSTVWGDKLTQYNVGTMSFDALGNPTSYYNDYRYTNMTWTHGRQLASLKKNLSGGVVNTVSYSYNSDGVRIGKVVNGVAVEYVLNGTQILAEKNGDHIIRYVYDAQGLPVGMILDGVTYLYEKNIFGDVVGIYNTSGTKVVTYKYTAWGVVIDSYCESGYEDVRRLNPFRYRGYYFDTETDFYYLQSRYYDPRTGRFINADGYVNANGDLQGFNMYAYCSNNPIMYVDPTGEGLLWWLWLWFNKAGTDSGIGANVTATKDDNTTMDLIFIQLTNGTKQSKSRTIIGRTSGDITLTGELEVENGEPSISIEGSVYGMAAKASSEGLSVSMAAENDNQSISLELARSHFGDFSLEFSRTAELNGVSVTSYQTITINGKRVATVLLFVLGVIACPGAVPALVPVF